MNRNVGNEIKGWAKAILALLTILSVLIGLVLCIIFMNQDQGGIGIALLIGISVIGYIFARLLSVVLYGYGELIDSVGLIRQKLDSIVSDSE